MSAAFTQRTTRPFLAVPHDFLDEALPSLSGDAFKVALAIYRETAGWNRPEAPISYTRLERLTGIHRRPTLVAAVQEAIHKGFIKLCDAFGLRGTRFYAIAEKFLTSSTGELVRSEPVAQTGPTSSPVELVNRRLVHQMNQNQFTSRTSSSSPDELVTANAASQGQAPDEPKESVKETYKENEEEAPTARMADAMPLWDQEMFSEQRKRLRTLLQQVRDLRHAGAPASDYLPLQAQADTLEATITHQTDLLLSDSQGPGNASGGGLHESAQADEQADTPQEDMFTAVAHALGYPDTRRMNTSARNTVGKAKKEFEQVGVKPGQVDTVVRSYRASNRNFNIWAFLSELPKYATAALGGA